MAEWQRAKDGREYVKREGKGWPVWRKGDETPEQALARAAAPKLAAQPTPAATPQLPAGDPPADEDPILRLIRDAKDEPRKPDPPPKLTGSTSKGGGGKSKLPTDADLERVLAEVLSAPAVPMLLFAHCEFCSEHFATEGPNAAAQLVKLSQDHPPLRRFLTTIYNVWEDVTWAVILTAYIGKPMLHHLAPAPVLAMAGPVVGVPPRANMRGHSSVVSEPVEDNAADAA
jgi:hypothetical protein